MLLQEVAVWKPAYRALQATWLDGSARWHYRRLNHHRERLAATAAGARLMERELFAHVVAADAAFRAIERRVLRQMADLDNN